MNCSVISSFFLTLISILMICQPGVIIAGKIDKWCFKSQPDCVCSMDKVREELSSIVRSYRGAELEDEIKKYKCYDFERLPKTLEIDGTSSTFIDHERGHFKHENERRRRRLLLASRKIRRKRQVLLGVPTDDIFNEAIVQLNPRAYHQYSILGSSIEFICTGPNVDVMLDDIVPKRYTWTHYNGQPVTAPQSNVNKETGTLSLKSVQLTDTGIYNCSIEYDKENGDVAFKNFSHQLSVVSEPVFLLKSSIRYSTDSCERHEKTQISENFANWITELVCPYCQLHNFTIHCVHAFNESEDVSRREYELSSVISTVGLDVQFSKTSSEYGKLQSCTVSCAELYQARLLEIVRDSLIKLFSLPIEIKVGNENPNIVHSPVPESFDMSLLLGCLAGFHLSFKLCFPCDTGHYSPEDNSNCFPCTIGSYQPLPGSSACIHCPANHKTMQTGSVSPSDCILNSAVDIASAVMKYKFIFSILLGIIILIVIILVSIRCFCPANSGLGKFVNGYCCCCCPAKDRYGYEDEEISMTTIPRSTTPYKRIPNRDSGDEEEESAYRKRSKRDGKSKHGRSNSSARFVKTDKVEVDEKEESMEQVLKNKSSAKRKKEIWVEEEEDLELQMHENVKGHHEGGQFKLQTHEHKKSSTPAAIAHKSGTNLASANGYCSPRSAASHKDRLWLHRCVKKPSPENAGKLKDTHAKPNSNLNPGQIHPHNKYFIPIPPPMPNFSYS